MTSTPSRHYGCSSVTSIPQRDRTSLKFDPENDVICKKILDFTRLGEWLTTKDLLSHLDIKISDDNSQFLEFFHFKRDPVKILFKYCMEKSKNMVDYEISEFSKIFNLPKELVMLILEISKDPDKKRNKNQPLITDFLCDGIKEIYKINEYILFSILDTVMEFFQGRYFDFSVIKVIETILSLKGHIAYDCRGFNSTDRACLLDDIITHTYSWSLENIEDNLITPEFIELLSNNEHYILEPLYIENRGGLVLNSLLMTMIDSTFVKTSAILHYLDIIHEEYSNKIKYGSENNYFIEYINHSDAYGLTALDMALCIDDPSVAFKLLEYGVEYGQVNIPYGGSSSHLIYAIEHSHFDLAKKFLELRPSMIDDIAEYEYRFEHKTKRINVYGTALEQKKFLEEKMKDPELVKKADEFIEFLRSLAGPDLIVVNEVKVMGEVVGQVMDVGQADEENFDEVD